MLAAVATHTKKVRLGTICMASFPVRHPVLLAIQWASLDQISKGRALLGVCIGGAHEGELRAFGVKREERVGRMKEGIQLLRQIWSDEEVDSSRQILHARRLQHRAQAGAKAAADLDRREP